MTQRTWWRAREWMMWRMLSKLSLLWVDCCRLTMATCSHKSRQGLTPPWNAIWVSSTAAAARHRRHLSSSRGAAPRCSPAWKSFAGKKMGFFFQKNKKYIFELKQKTLSLEVLLRQGRVPNVCLQWCWITRTMHFASVRKQRKLWNVQTRRHRLSNLHIGLVELHWQETARRGLHNQNLWGNASTVFGKHCECIAQTWKCTHLERLPPLANHLLLLSQCVRTRHGGKKKWQTCMLHRGLESGSVRNKVIEAATFPIRTVVPNGS